MKKKDDSCQNATISQVLVPIIFLVAFTIRIFLAQFFLNSTFDKSGLISGDIYKHKDWAIATYKYGINQTYYPNNKKLGISQNNQPFGTAYLFAGVYAIYLQIIEIYQNIIHIKILRHIVDTNFLLIIKPISIAADLLLGLLIYKVVKDRSTIKWALISLLLYLFNPAIIYNSAVWGQTDSINNILFFMAILLLIIQKPIFASLIYCCSILLKLSLLPLLPLFFLLQTLLIRGDKLKKIILSIVFSSLFIITCTYTVSTNPIKWLSNFMIANSQGELAYITVYAFNFWWMVFRPKFILDIPSSGTIFLGITLSTWGYLFFLATVIPLFTKLILIFKKEKKVDFDLVILSVFVTEFLMFLFLPRMHERYLYPVIPFFLVYLGISKRKIINISLFVILSIIHFINIYIVWHPLYLFPILFEGLIAHWKVRLLMSLSLLVTCAYYYQRLICFKQNRQKF